MRDIIFRTSTAVKACVRDGWHIVFNHSVLCPDASECLPEQNKFLLIPTGTNTVVWLRLRKFDGCGEWS